MGNTSLTVVVAAGGTGGHLFPAVALAGVLRERGHRVHLMTDDRAEKYTSDLPVEAVHLVRSASPSGGGLIGKIKVAWALGWGTLQARVQLAKIKADIVVGFGGYPTVPPVMGASLLGLPTVIHEANAVLGRANKLLATRATAIAVSASTTSGLGKRADKAVHTGNPVRDAVRTAAALDYAAPGPENTIHLLVFGGSQGAHVFSQIVPAALKLLPDAVRKRIRLTQQVRPEDRDELGRTLTDLAIDHEIASFFANMAERIAATHFVVCRSGASTVSELSVIGRPALLVPYPHALDHDQRKNAAALMIAGGAIAIEEKDLSPDRLARELTTWLTDAERLTQAAIAAKSTGHPDAEIKLADLVEATAAR